MSKKKEFIEGVDFVLLNGSVIMTEKYLKDRGYCCGNGCINCPYNPRWTKDTKTLNENNNKDLQN